MYTLKGFIAIPPFANNTPGVIAPLGEISTQSLTFSREKGFYAQPAQPDVALVSFTSVEEDGTKVEVPVAIRNQVLEIAQYLVTMTVDNELEFTRDEVRDALMVEFGPDAIDIVVGDITTDGRHYMPEWVSWRYAGAAENQIRVWFSDPAFHNQYDSYEIVVIPPFTPIDNFFLVGSEVDTMLRNMTIPIAINRAQEARQTYPETYLRAEQYQYIDPLNNNHRVLSTWVFLIYGPAGNNTDAIKDAAVAYIAENSTRPHSSWLPILPDLFRRTEFILIPLEDQYAIPNQTLQAGIYSPIVNLTRANTVLTQFAKSVDGTPYPPFQINTYGATMGHPYKSVAVLSVGGPDNINDQFRLVDVFPDWISVSSTSMDFNRMTQRTKNWSLMLAEMLIVAEVMTRFSSIPAGMGRVTRDGTLYLSSSFENINYLVAAKSNFPAPT